MGSFENDLINFIKHLLEHVRYPGIFLAMTIEGLGIPLPSEITMPLAGALSGTKFGSDFQAWLVVLVGTLGETLGACIGYAIGMYGGRPLLVRFGKYVLISPHDIDRATSWFERFGSVVVLIARLLPAVRSYVSIAAGVAKMSFAPFLFFSALGSLVWCTLLTFLGYKLGDHWQDISKATKPFEVPIFVGILILLAAYLFWRHLRPGHSEVEAQTAGQE